MLRLSLVLAVMAGVVLLLFSYFNGHAQLRRLGSEFDRLRAEQRARELGALKESHWTAQYRAPADCASAASALRALECQNQRDLARRDFERQWSARLATGWVPGEPSAQGGKVR